MCVCKKYVLNENDTQLDPYMTGWFCNELTGCCVLRNQEILCQLIFCFLTCYLKLALCIIKCFYFKAPELRKDTISSWLPVSQSLKVMRIRFK